MPKVLSSAQIEQFMEKGWVKLEQAYTEKHALAAQDYVWKQVEQRGVIREDAQTWTQPMVRINENYNTAEFRACKTERLINAIEDLIGEGSYIRRAEPIHWGWWPVNFSHGADREWDVPTEKWHVDGIHYPQFIDSKEQGLLMLCMFSETKPGGGGTLLAEYSHNIVANVLAEHPEGLSVKEVIELSTQHPWLAELVGNVPASDPQLSRIEHFMNKVTVDNKGNRLRVVETTGGPGDVILGHPFVFHAASQNHSGKPRFMCNNQAALFDKLNLQRKQDKDYTPLERSIKHAISE